jgi:hypothetical protein
MAPIVNAFAMKILTYEELTTCYDILNSLTILQFLNKYSLAFLLQSNEVYSCAQAVVRNQVRGKGPMTNLTQNMFLVVLLACVVSLGGCASYQNPYPPYQNPYTYQGAGVGAAVGAAIGAATNSNNPGMGAAIGGMLGGAADTVGREYARSQQPSQPQQGYYQQPGYGYPPPNQGYNRSPYYGQPSYGQPGPPPGYYYQGGSPMPYGPSQDMENPYYQYGY